MKLKGSPAQAPAKMSEMTAGCLAEWCHVLASDARLPLAWEMATAYVLRYTGLTGEEADERASLIFAAIALTADMIYNPGAHIDGDKINRVVEGFIGLHDFNLLPGEDGAAWAP